MANTLTGVFAGLEKKFDALKKEVRDVEKDLDRLDQNTLEKLKHLTAHYDRLNEQMQQMLGQKRQFDTLISRWAREIQDPELKEDVMRFIFGDISCEEVLDNDDGNGFITFTPEQSLERLERTMTCPPAPQKRRRDTDNNCL